MKMPASRGLVAVAASLVATGGLLAPHLAVAATDRGKDVRVVNTASEPVPVWGTVDVGNQPTVNVGNRPTVTVGNTPSVDVANTPTVHVGNTPTVDVQNSQADPLYVSQIAASSETPVQQFLFAASPDEGEACTEIEVSEGKRLRVETIAFEVDPFAQTDPQAYLQIIVRDLGGNNVSILGEELVPIGGGDTHSAVMHGPIFLDPNDMRPGQGGQICAANRSHVRAFVVGNEIPAA